MANGCFCADFSLENVNVELTWKPSCPPFPLLPCDSDLLLIPLDTSLTVEAPFEFFEFEGSKPLGIGLGSVIDLLENPERFDAGIGAVQRWTSSKFINLTLERVMG